MALVVQMLEGVLEEAGFVGAGEIELDGVFP
jgi:hypothetical protein